jgi:flagellar motor switch protein FliN/FliY
VEIELTVVLGRCTLPMRELLKMGRGAVIPLGTHADEQVWILANNYPIARGEISIDGERVTVVITEPADVRAFEAAA